MLTNTEQKRYRELYALVEGTNASPDEFKEYQALKEKDGGTPIFVFGSNEKGIHGGGAARAARDFHGAKMYQGFGRQGGSFAIPTCAIPTGQPGFEIPLDKVAQYVALFMEYAREHPELEFQVTQIGCGLAGWKAEQIAPLFAWAPENCLFDEAWKPLLGDGRRYWGTV